MVPPLVQNKLPEKFQAFSLRMHITFELENSFLYVILRSAIVPLCNVYNNPFYLWQFKYFCTVSRISINIPYATYLWNDYRFRQNIFNRSRWNRKSTQQSTHYSFTTVTLWSRTALCPGNLLLYQRMFPYCIKSQYRARFKCALKLHATHLYSEVTLLWNHDLCSRLLLKLWTIIHQI